MADVISSGFGGVMGSGFGPWVARGEMWGGFLDVVAASVGFFEVAVLESAACMGAGMINAQAISAKSASAGQVGWRVDMAKKSELNRKR